MYIGLNNLGLTGIQNRFSPSQVFLGGQAGLWLDSSNLNTGFQDSSGITPQTAVEQPTGMRLDIRLPRGVNTALFDGTTNDWTEANGGVLSIVGSSMRITNGEANFGAARKTFTTVEGKWYEIRSSFTLNTTNGSIWVGTTAGGFDLLDTNTAERGFFRAEGVLTHIQVLNASNTISAYFDLDSLVVQEVDGNHVIQTTSSARPLYDIAAGFSSDYFDGTDDSYFIATVSAGTFGNDMDCFVALSRASTQIGMVIHETAGDVKWIGEFNPADSASDSASGGVGSNKTHCVNGVQVAGGTTTSGQELAAAMPEATPLVLEVRNLDLSDWTNLIVAGNYGAGYVFHGDIAGVIICPAQDDETRAQIRKWLGAKIGLVL